MLHLKESLQEEIFYYVAQFRQNIQKYKKWKKSWILIRHFWQRKIQTIKIQLFFIFCIFEYFDEILLLSRKFPPGAILYYVA